MNGSEFWKMVNQQIAPVSSAIEPAARDKIDGKTKPLGALGRLEDLAIQLAQVQQSLDPLIDRKALFVFAADHGIAAAGVSAFPAEVTGQMVLNFLNGGAAINVLCRHHGIEIMVVDMGVNADFAAHPLLLNKKVRKGTRNFALEPAMTHDEAVRAVTAGMEVFLRAYDQRPVQIVGVGEMGIANTTSASAIISAITGITALEATGKGTGLDDAGVLHKALVIEKALALQQVDPQDGWDVLTKVGGYEIAGIVGMTLAAAARRCLVVLDGVISTAAGLIAYLINPMIGGYLVAGHKSVEKAQAAALSRMGLTPLIDLGMRLGEGTGAALAIEIVAAAARIMREMASFTDAGVSNRE